MLDAYDEVRGLFDQLLALTDNPEIERLSHQISVRCAAYMEHIEPLPTVEKHLTPGEAKAFALLLRRRGKICSKDAIVNACSLSGEAGDDVVRVRICGLRRKLPPQYVIESIWGTGYRLAA